MQKATYLTTMSKNTVLKQQAATKAEVIFLGIDVHADKQVAVRQIHSGVGLGLYCAMLSKVGRSEEGDRDAE